VTYIDAAAGWVLRRELVRRAREGRPLAVVGARPAVRRVWDLCGFDPALLGPTGA
jgi:anti-anti-sigma regulatory factor